MGQPEVLRALKATFEAILAPQNLELVDVSFLPSDRGRILEVLIDREGEKLSLDEIAAVSEEISRALDIDDPIEGRYTLEVASAGIERPLTKPSDYVRFQGSEIKVKLDEPIEGRRNFKGAILSSNEDAFVLEIEGGERVEIPYDSVSKARLVVDWDAEFKRASRGRKTG